MVAESIPGGVYGLIALVMVVVSTGIALKAVQAYMKVPKGEFDGRMTVNSAIQGFFISTPVVIATVTAGVGHLDSTSELGVLGFFGTMVGAVMAVAGIDSVSKGVGQKLKRGTA